MMEAVLDVNGGIVRHGPASPCRGGFIVKLSFLFYAPIPDLSDLDRRMARIAGLGYQGIELSASHPLPYPVEEVLALSRKHSLPVVSLLSGWSYSNEGLCLASPHAEVRR